MSNQMGDRYACSDPNCGCEIKIERPCGMFSSEGSAVVADAPFRREFRSEGVSTTGDYGDQGASGEGTFGTAGSSDRSATASGRYDTEATRMHPTAGASGRTLSLTCFCGRAMREVGREQQSQAARSGARS